MFTLLDLKRARPLAGTLFNVLFNLNKFIAFETRDPFVVRQVRSKQHVRRAAPVSCGGVRAAFQACGPCSVRQEGGYCGRDAPGAGGAGAESGAERLGPLRMQPCGRLWLFTHGSLLRSLPFPLPRRQEREESGLTEWDRFARAEYVRLAVEEDGDDSPHSSWTQAVEAAL